MSISIEELLQKTITEKEKTIEIQRAIIDALKSTIKLKDKQIGLLEKSCANPKSRAIDLQ